MCELKKNGKVFTRKSVGTGPSSYEKWVYRAAVSQRLRNTDVDDHSLNVHHPGHLKSHYSEFLEPFGALLCILTGGARVRRLQLEASVDRNYSAFWHLVVSWMPSCRRIPLPTVSGSNLVCRRPVQSVSRLHRMENARCHNLEDDGPTENLKSDVNQFVFVNGQVPVSCNVWGHVSGFAADLKSCVMLCRPVNVHR